MMHFIDLSDHFAHADPTILKINFLRFSDQEFSRYNTRFMYQNRLRASDWRCIIESQGFDVVHWVPQVDKQALAQLDSIELNQSYQNPHPEDICTTGLKVIAERL
jgi:hypothetical protein